MDKPTELPPYQPPDQQSYPPPAQQSGYNVHPTQQPGYGYIPQPPQPGYSMAPAPQSTVQNTNIVVMTGGPTGPVGPRGWTTGICSCCSDCESCCCEWWCSCCHACQIAGKLGEPSCLVGCCCYTCFSASHMRTKLRTMHRITAGEDICWDICMFLYCKPCMMCQMSRELKHIGL